MKVQRNYFIHISTFVIGLFFLFNVGASYALEGVNTDEGSNYYLIHYDGEEQSISITEEVTLQLTGWVDETQSSVNARISDTTNQVNDIVLNVSDNLNELSINEGESINYRIINHDTFKVDDVNPLELIEQSTVVEKNDNGTFVEERKTVDEYGTLIEMIGYTYFFTDESNQVVAITEEEYKSKNDQRNLADESTILAQQSKDVENDVQSSLSPKKKTTVSVKTDPVERIESPSVVYSTHAQSYGWLESVADGEMAGTQGKGKRLEAVQISIVDAPYTGGISYKTHVQSYGWLESVKNGEISGTTGQSKRVEAIQITLTGELANHYDVYYRVHTQSYGWLDWSKNGQSAGTEGLSKRMEAFEVMLVKKGGEAPGLTDKPFVVKPTVVKPSVVYSTHVQTYSWMNAVADGAMSGSKGQSKRLEAIKIDLKNAPYSGGITYSTHVQKYGWLTSVGGGDISGTTGESKRVEAIRINLTGEMAKHYDVYYRVHSQSYGWLGWVKNGMKSGSEGLSKRLEGIEIKLVLKGQGASVSEGKGFKQPFLVFIDPGHGGYDPGATASGYEEGDLNLAVAKKVQSLLLDRGYRVKMARNNDTYKSLYDRPQLANDTQADIMVSIHTNSTAGGETTVNGIESYYYKYIPEYPSKINKDMHDDPNRIERSVKLATLIQSNMVDYTGANNRGVHGDTFAVIREAAMPATLIEMGFINNQKERQNLIKNSYQTKLAKAIADGIDKYFNKYN